ncbi:peroxisomal membrane protein 11A isoform X2 [Erpetoichthys calabaricus]|uniref:Peroxisomal biogenesis factor 11 alpha n=1 Tax=Erpetoichthys calabaricus TaxID=27687 RepID=A0A8C4SY61_ERPCA|nr:peroxisomal membrane protein 11A isoform X2 [Erpetoichthys calabaricus]
MEAFLKLSSQSRGRDRMLRTTQYACTLLKYLLQNNSTQKELLKKLHNLESNMSTGRKLFRLGNMVDSIGGVQKALQLPNPEVRLLLVASCLVRTLYIICDNLLWARSIRVINSINKEKWSLLATQFYFISLIMGLVRDIYELYQAMKQDARGQQLQKKIGQHISEGPDVACVGVFRLEHFLILLYHSLKKNPPLLLDSVKNVCDLFIPMDRLGIYKTNSGVVGMCGLASSLFGILTMLKPSLRLSP